MNIKFTFLINSQMLAELLSATMLINNGDRNALKLFSTSTIIIVMINVNQNRLPLLRYPMKIKV